MRENDLKSMKNMKQYNWCSAYIYNYIYIASPFDQPKGFSCYYWVKRRRDTKQIKQRCRGEETNVRF